MPVYLNLKQFIREYEAKYQRDLTWADIQAATGLASSTLNRLLNDAPRRVDIDVLDRLCTFFGVEAGPVPFVLYEPDDPTTTHQNTPPD